MAPENPLPPELPRTTPNPAWNRAWYPAGLLGLVAALACPPAGAQQYLYVCKSHGRTLSDSVPPTECKNEDIRELNPDGTLHRLIPAPLTPEQRRQRDKDEAARLEQEAKQREQSRKDRSLLETYGSVSEIEAARKRAITSSQALIDRADQKLAQYAKEKKRLDDEAEFYAKREMPTKLKSEFDYNRTLTAQQEQAKVEAQKGIDKIKERYDAEEKRYRELEDMAMKAAAAREQESGGITPGNN